MIMSWGKPLLMLGLMSGLVCCQQTNPPPTNAPCAPNARPTGVIIAGSGAGLPLLRALNARMNPDNDAHKLVIPGSIGSSGGLRALKDGAIDAAITLRMPTPQERQEHKWRVRVLAKTPIVFASTTQQAGFTAAQLNTIYNYKQITWPGTQDTITPLKREPTDGSLSIITTVNPKLAETLKTSHQQDLVLTTDQDMLQTLLDVPGAVGWLSYGMTQLAGSTLHILYPTPQEVRSGAKWQQTLYLIYPQQNHEPLERFFRFLEQDDTRKWMRDHGYRAEASR